MNSEHMKQNVINIILIVMLTTSQCEGMGLTEKRQLREKVLEMFNHAYQNYMEHAYPADELMPLSCQGRYRGTQPSRGDIDDALGNFSLTLVDTLDTLVVLGQLDRFEEAVHLVIRDVSFDKDIVVSVFETNIRMLGGLLGGHVMAEEMKRQKERMQWYKGQLLDLAVDLGDRLLPAFNTSTGIPFPKVNLRHGYKPTLARTGHEKDTCTACAGTMILEFAALSRLTGNMVYEEKAHKAMEYLWMSRHRASDLVGTVINIHSGDWVRRESGIGAGIDSYYEYMLKAYILLGDETYLTRFNKHYAAVMKYISQGPMMLDVHMHKPLRSSRNFMDALFAFWPGLQVLKGDIKPAIEIHEMLYQVTQIHNFLPEAFTTDFRIHWGHHPLRPEFIESTYFIHKATSDPYYLQVGKTIVNNLETYARVDCGFAAIKNVQTGVLEDQMDSYVMAETFKYLYLLFAEKEDMVIDVDDYVFTTEAHLLPLSLSLHPFNNTKEPGARRSVHHEDDSGHDRSCPNTNSRSHTTVHYAQNLRSPLKNLVRNHCVKPSVKASRQRLHAADFVAGRSDHLQLLKKMGIQIVTVSDGRVQLLHTASEAASEEDGNDGLLFMQEMIELSKAENAESQYERRVVQIVSPPYLGTISLTAGPAQFGPDLKNTNGIEGRLVKTDPFTACEGLTTDVRGHVALVQRGGCMFIDKARILQTAGAIGAIVVDNNDGSSSEGSPLFAMSGDGRSDVTIPMVFLFHKEGAVLEKGLAEYSSLSVLLTDKARKAEDIAKETLARQAGSVMGDVRERKAAGDGDSHTERSMYFASFDDVRLDVRSQSVVATSSVDAGIVRVERDPESGLPRVHLEQLEDTYKRRLTSGKIARLLHGVDTFDRLSTKEYSDHLYALGKLMQAIFANDEIPGSVSMEALLNKLSLDEATDMDTAGDDGLTERKEQLLKRINALLSGYVSKQLRELFPNTGDLLAEVSVEISGQRRLGVADPANWVALARWGTESPPVCGVGSVPSGDTGRTERTRGETAGASLTPSQGGTDSATEVPPDTTLSSVEARLAAVEHDETLTASERLERHKLQLKQQQLLLQKQHQQQQLQQQHADMNKDPSSVSDHDSAEVSSSSKHTDTRTPDSKSVDSDSDVSTQKTSTHSSDDEL